MSRDESQKSAKLLRPYTIKEAAEILGLANPRQIKNYADIKLYGIEPMHVGQGQGSRKLYSWEQLQKIAIAERLRKNGFEPKAIGEALRVVEFYREMDADDLAKASRLTSVPSGAFLPFASGILIMRNSEWRIINWRDFKIDKKAIMEGFFAVDITEVQNDALRRWMKWSEKNQ